MSKTIKRRIVIVAAVLLLLLFAASLLLAIPLGGRASVLPVSVFYAVGGSVAAIFLVSSVILFLRKARGS